MRSLLTLIAFSSLSLGGCSCATPEPGTDVPADASTDVSAPDAPYFDAPDPLDAELDAADASSGDASEGDASEDAGADAGACVRTGYPIDYTPTRAEREMIATAAAAFTAETGATPTFDDLTGAVNGFEGLPIPIELDDGVADRCERARLGLLAFFARYPDLFHMPDDLTMRACHYDSVTDSEIVRLSGGTYDGRRLLVSGGSTNDLVAHVTRSATLRYFGGDYQPAYQRGEAEPCFTVEQLRDRVVGQALEYQRFSACVPGGPGSILVEGRDTRTVGDAILFRDEAGALHWAAEVEVLLAADHVGPDEVNSTLFCCFEASLEGCVGKILIVDEVTGEILQQLDRCHTC
jgi:hypothetical protein